MAHGKLPNLVSGADALLNLDLPGPEAILGSRTRLLMATQLGLTSVTSTGSELARDMADAGAAIAIPTGDARAMANTLQRLFLEGLDVSMPRRAQDWMRASLDPTRLLQPMLHWVSSPTRSPQGIHYQVSMARQLEHCRAQLRAIHGSPTWRALARLHRAISPLLAARGLFPDKTIPEQE